MKLNTKLVITFILFMVVPLLLLGASYMILRYGFGFLIIERVSINGKNSFVMSQESLLSVIIVIFCVVILTGIALSNWLMYSFIKPINQLKKALHNIENGDYDTSLIKPKQAEFEGLFKDFESMRIKLKENRDRRNLAEKQNRELIANITHDLKTPITSIRGYVEGIMDGVADTEEKMDRYIKTIYNKANALNALINELTGYSKIDAREITYNFVRLSVDEYFGDCASEMIFDLQEQGVKFVYDNRVKKSIAVLADPVQLSKVIHNIISNSVKYKSPEHSVIRMRIKDMGEHIQVDVRDNGMGIPKQDTEKIFDRFFRSDASRNSDKGGNGIGLSIAKKIIEDHGGKIWATVDGSVGLTIHFTLRKYTDEIKSDYTKEPTQINIDIENMGYEDEDSLNFEEASDKPSNEEPANKEETAVNDYKKETDLEKEKIKDSIKKGESSEKEDADNSEAIQNYNEVINILGDFEDEE
ncbi:MAG: HAMP domain-containing histidine kinase [Lachnospiraceae bacterium]|nr:HAMP domain-containing histidine kinase [Lachnospiraceae bacterium]